MNTRKTIELCNVTKVIKSRTILDHISLSLEQGGVYGFYGSNGSGKSMLFKAIAGLIHLTEGSITVFGQQIGKDCDFPSNMGCMFNSLMWDEYTGFENLEMLASIQKKISKTEIDCALERVGLHVDDTREYKKYSLGMKQRLDLAQAIMEKPDLLILDEPSNALDSTGLALLCSIIREEHNRGATILIAAHNTPELEALCTVSYTICEGKLQLCKP